MKKSKKLLSLFLSVLMIIACLSPMAALADSINTVQTAETVYLNNPTVTTFRYGSPNGDYDNYFYERTKYFKFTPSYSGYFEFNATGYLNDVYRAGYTPTIDIDIHDIYGNAIKFGYTNDYTMETKFAVSLQQGMTYIIELTNYNVDDIKAFDDIESAGGIGYAQQSITMTVTPHEHVYKVTEWYYSVDYECYFCDYSYSVNKETHQQTTYDSPTIVYNEVGSVNLSSYSYTYNGKVQAPSVVAYDTYGNVISSSAYSVYVYGDKKSVGSYAVSVYFNSTYGSYSTTKYYTIYPKTTKVKSASAKKKAVNVKWGKQSAQVSGYQIQVATNKGFTKNVKTLNVSKNSKTSGVVKGLKSKKKYYIRIRTFKKVNGSPIYSAWKTYSKTVKTK